MPDTNNDLRRTGWTDVAVSRTDVLVGMLILLIMALIAPLAMMSSRNQARLAKCENNLRRIGLGLHVHAALKGSSGRLSTGVADLKNDGCPDTIGWMADGLRGGFFGPDELQCPSNPVRNSEVLLQLLRYDSDDIPTEQSSNRQLLHYPPVKPSPFCENLANSGKVNSLRRAAYIKRDFLDQGYGTNYAASWYFGRTSVRTSQVGRSALVFSSPRTRAGCSGPLSLATLDLAKAPGCNIPLLGDGAVSQHALSQTIANHLETTTKLVRTMNNGPVYWNRRVEKVISLDQAGTEAALVGHPVQRFSRGVDFQWATEGDIYNRLELASFLDDDRLKLLAEFDKKFGGKDRVHWLQDTSAWGIVHQGKLPILMADGSVNVFTDIDRDGTLNPGFPKLPAHWNKLAYWEKVQQFRSFREMPPHEIFNGGQLIGPSPIAGNGFQSD